MSGWKGTLHTHGEGLTYFLLQLEYSMEHIGHLVKCELTLCKIMEDEGWLSGYCTDVGCIV